MKLLLHMCCGPCSVYPVTALQQEAVQLEGLFYNPNIHPREEFTRRKENLLVLAQTKEIPVTCLDDFMQEVWERFPDEQAERCRMCYAVRLDKTAAMAKERGFDAFSTTLLVSPYQNHELIRELGEKAAARYGVAFFYRDFRPGFREGQAEAKELGLYRQKFCGCIRSLEESPFREKILKQLNARESS